MASDNIFHVPYVNKKESTKRSGTRILSLIGFLKLRVRKRIHISRPLHYLHVLISKRCLVRRDRSGRS